MIKAPRPYEMTVPVPTQVQVDAELRDDCTYLHLAVGGDTREVALFPCAPHQLPELAAPFAAGDVTLELASDLPGFPVGPRYLVLKVGTEALAAGEAPL